VKDATKRLGENLQKMRKARRPDLSQTEVQRILGYSVDARAVSRWETGEFAPRVDELDRLAGLYGCTIGDFFTSEPPARPALGTTLTDAWKILRAFQKATHDKRQKILVMLGLSDSPSPDSALAAALSLDQPKPVKQKSDK
jgi:transcriptional regulator with XRE-family HTH domain